MLRLSHKNKDKDKDHKTITSKQLESLIQELTVKVKPYEDRMLNPGSISPRTNTSSNSNSSPNSNISFMKECYKNEINQIVSKLRDFSLACFTNLNIMDVTTKPRQETTGDYRAYLDCSDNLSTMVKQDVLDSADAQHELIKFERWVYILKLCHEQYDYFSAAAIVAALTNGAIKNTDLLSPGAQAVLKYYSTFYCNQSQVHAMQINQNKLNQKIIPTLAPLVSMLAMVSSQQGTTDDKKKQELKDYEINASKEYRDVYIVMQDCFKDISKPESVLYSSLNIPSNSELETYYYKIARKLEKKNTPSSEELENIKQFNLYDADDKYYEHKCNLVSLKEKILDYAARNILDSDTNTVKNQILLELKNDHLDMLKINELENVIKHNNTMDNTLRDICVNIISEFKLLENVKRKKQIINPDAVPEKKEVANEVHDVIRASKSHRKLQRQKNVATINTLFKAQSLPTVQTADQHDLDEPVTRAQSEDGIILVTQSCTGKK